MIKNRVSAEMPVEVETQAMDAITALKGMFPFLVDLTPDERVRMAKMSRLRVDFVDKAELYADQRPELVPSYVQVDEFKKDLDLRRGLERVFASIYPLVEKVSDTIMVLKSEAYEASRLFYKAVQDADAAGVEGTEQILGVLSPHFKRAANKTKKDNSSTTGSSDTPQAGS